MRQQLLGSIHDKHAAHIQAQAVTFITLHHQVQWGLGRQIQEIGIVLAAFNVVVGPGQRVLEVMTQVLVK